MNPAIQWQSHRAAWSSSQGRSQNIKKYHFIVGEVGLVQARTCSISQAGKDKVQTKEVYVKRGRAQNHGTQYSVQRQGI